MLTYIYVIILDRFTLGTDAPRPYKRPFVTHNLISSQDSSVPLPQFQMAPRLNILMSSGSKRNPDILSFSTKCLGKRIPFRFPNGPPMGRDAHIQSLSFVQGPQQRGPPHRPSELCLFRERRSIPTAPFIQLSKSP